MGFPHSKASHKARQERSLMLCQFVICAPQQSSNIEITNLCHFTSPDESMISKTSAKMKLRHRCAILITKAYGACAVTLNQEMMATGQDRHRHKFTSTWNISMCGVTKLFCQKSKVLERFENVSVDFKFSCQND